MWTLREGRNIHMLTPHCVRYTVFKSDESKKRVNTFNKKVLKQKLSTNTSVYGVFVLFCAHAKEITIITMKE